MERKIIWCSIEEWICKSTIANMFCVSICDYLIELAPLSSICRNILNRNFCSSNILCNRGFVNTFKNSIFYSSRIYVTSISSDFNCVPFLCNSSVKIIVCNYIFNFSWYKFAANINFSFSFSTF